MTREYDIVIAGGGIVGAAAALALAPGGARIAVVEPLPRTGSAGDGRGLALSPASIRILERFGVWDALAPESGPIRNIHVSEEGAFGCVRLDARILGLDAVGQVVPAGLLGRTLMESLAAMDNVDVMCPARVVGVDRAASRVTLEQDGGTRDLAGRLLVAADGTGSPVRSMLGIEARRRDYRQVAFVATVTAGRGHADTAYERFSRRGPFAALPLPGSRCVTVCCVAAGEADDCAALDDGAWLALINRRSGGRLGPLTAAGPRQRYPLAQVIAERQVLPGAVLMGNAAHTLHPNAAQGLNLALRDVAALAECLLPVLAAGADPSAVDVLDGYVRGRAADQRRVARFTDGLARVFHRPGRLAALGRGLAMVTLDLAPALKQELVRSAAGLSGRQPAWVRGAA